MSKLGKRLLRAADEAIAIARGTADPATYRVYIPKKVDVVAIRKKTKLSQNEFALKFGISAATLRDWEQKRKEPQAMARAFLTVIDQEPEVVLKALSAA